jgi:hypothetical protein
MERQFNELYFSGSASSELALAKIALYKPFTLLIFSSWIRLQINKGYHPVTKDEMLYWEDAMNNEVLTLLRGDPYRFAKDLMGKTDPINIISLRF